MAPERDPVEPWAAFIPSTLPRSFKGKILTGIAVPVPKIMALPMPSRLSDTIRIDDVGGSKTTGMKQ